jgi:hypothetical protein
MKDPREDGLRMSIFLRSCILTLFLPLFTAGQTPVSKLPAEIAREQSQAVVIVEPTDANGRALAQGSGFIVTPSGAIITNFHVIRGAARVRVKLQSGDVYQTSDLIDVDQDKDIAILKIKGFKLPTVRLGDSDRTEVGESVVVISSPEGLSNSLTTGVLSGVRRLETYRVFQITAPISQGSSGGALFDGSGAVIGITTYIMRSGQNINFAVPINYARGMISDESRLTLSSLPAAAPLGPAPPTMSARQQAIPEETEDEISTEVRTATRPRLGRTAHEPMYTRLDEAMGFFYRMVDGIMHYSQREVEDLTRTATLVKSSETAEASQYTIKFLSFNIGAAFNFRKQDSLLESVDMLVNWSLADLERNYGNKYKRRTIDGRKALEYKRTEDGHHIQAFIDENSNVRVVKFLSTRP